ncbi:LolA family protein [Pirellulaceae bacterium SH501]
MDLDEMINRCTDLIRSEDLDSQSIQRTKVAVLAQLRAQESGQSQRKLIRPWLPSLAIASLVSCVITIVISFWNIGGGSNAYAEVLQNLKRGGVHFTISKVADDGSLKPGIEYWISKEGAIRSVAGNSVMICDKYGNPKLDYSTDPGVAKDAFVYKSAPRTKLNSFEDTWIGLLDRPENGVLLKDKTSDGILCYEVTSADGVLRFEVHVDPSKNSIASIDFVSSNPDPLLGGKFIIRDIQVNQDFDPSLFRFDPPKGYRHVFVE